MSLLRDRHPGSKVSSLIQNDGDLKINGKFAIGFQDGQLVDQYEASVMDQGLASGFFDITRMAGGATNTSSLHMRLESDRIHGKTGDYGINLNFIDSEFGDVAAYTYKKASIDGAIQYLSDFVNDTNNSQHVLYHYIAQLAPIFGIISGTTPLGSSSSKEDAKRAVLSNLSKYSNVVSFPNKEEYDSLLENIKTNPDSFHSLENTIRITLDLTGISESFAEPFDVVIDFNGTETSLINIRIENLKWGDKYAMLDVGIIDAYDDGVFNFKKAKIDGFTLQLHNKNDLQNKPYIDLSDLPILLEVGINTTKETKYHFSGLFKYLNYDYPLDFYIRITDTVNPETGLLNVIGFISIGYANNVNHNIFKSYIFIKENIIYYKKVKEIWEYQVWPPKFIHVSDRIDYFKVTSDQFLNDIIEYLCLTMIESTFLYNQIQGNSSATTSTKPLDFIESFKNNPNAEPGKKGEFTLEVSGNLKALVSLSGAIRIEYTPSTLTLQGVYITLTVAVVASIAIDLDVKADTTELIKQYEDNYFSLIQAFETNPNTSVLPFRTNPFPDKVPADQHYTVTVPASNNTSGIGESVFIK